ncbi:MAG: HAD hydrolase-like protein [Candidatus Heimdallarchaeota archaeon]|nr:HAD hydrolase-like protein [Candidatus Heimdallarchaeota archaeon]
MTISKILFDMDSTIIAIDEENFTRHYFRLLAERSFPDLPLAVISKTIMDATKTVMIQSIPEELTMETFMREMSPRLQQSPENLFEIFMEFYQNHFDDLKSYIRPADGAKTVIQTCFDQGYDVVIATTPVFPEIPIKKRLLWGDVLDFDYKLITHAENMHYSKPLAEYYLEIIDMLGCEVKECIMVGNEFIGDIVAPAKIGMKTFYCPRETVVDEMLRKIQKEYGDIEPTYQGTLHDFEELVKNNFADKGH